MALGTPDEVTEFFGAVTNCLTNLPLERLEAERRILATESDSRQRTTADILRIYRFGTQGPGAGAYDEYALRSISPGQVSDWAAHWFTAGNAAMWITGVLPPDLRLTLPPGGRRPVSRPWTTDFAGPGHVTGRVAGLAASMIVPRGAESAALEWILQRRLFDRLRLRDAVSYSITAERQAVDAGRNELFVFIDGLPAAQEQLERGTLQVLDELARAGCREEELVEWRRQWLRPLAEAAGMAGLLHQLAVDQLYGTYPTQSPDLGSQAAAVNPDTVRDLAAAAYRTTLFCVPAESPVIGQQTPALPGWCATPVSGRRFPPTSPNDMGRLVIGDEGVSYVLDAERRVTVRWPECAAVLRWDDGGRRLLGTDGTWLDLPPEAWHDFAALRAEIDRHTRPGQVVEMGEAPSRPPVPLPRAKLLGTTSTGALATLAVVETLFALLLATAGLIPFLIVGLPLLLGVAWQCRELYLRRKGVRGTSGGRAPRAARPLRHTPRHILWVALGVSLTCTVGLGLAATSGANVGALAALFGITGLSALRELLRRSWSGRGGS